MTINITIWNEFQHEQNNPTVKAIYPDGIHEAIAQPLRQYSDLAVAVATLDEPEHGLTIERLKQTDVLLWWGHMAHDKVDDAIVERVYGRVMEGMGLIVLHSGHYAKVFKRLMGTDCSLRWREDGGKERLWVVAPGHPIAEGLGDYFEIPHTEMYGEFFNIPTPDELVFVSWFEGGEVFRSGCCYRRGKGRIFYFRPGHETFPIFYQAEVQRVILNAIHWAVPLNRTPLERDAIHVPNQMS